MFEALYLSPHFDDVVFSCGGAIHQRVQRGERVVVVTVCAAPPPLALSPFAQSLHARWQAAGEFDRAAEDRQALQRLGAEFVHLSYHDCIYRRAPTGEWLYDSEESLWREMAPAEDPLIEELAKVFAEAALLKPQAEVWSPFALGNHVDHKLVKAAASAWGQTAHRRIRYYADYPYAATVAGGSPLLLNLADRQAKLAAFKCYRSQLSTFWKDEIAMLEAVNGWVERFFD